MTEVGVVMDQTVWLNFKLPIAAVEGDEVEVLGTKPLVEKGSTSKKVTVSSEAIQSLPIRDLSELYTLQSGVVKVVSRNKSVPDHEERGLEQIHVKGGRSGEIAYMMDGMYLRNPIFGSIGSGTRLMSLQLVNLIGNRVALMLNMAMLNLLFLTGILVLEARRFEYRFKFETSQVGALKSALLVMT